MVAAIQTLHKHFNLVLLNPCLVELRLVVATPLQIGTLKLMEMVQIIQIMPLIYFQPTPLYTQSGVHYFIQLHTIT